MHIGILQTGHVAPALVAAHGDYDTIFTQFLANRGLRFSNHRVVDMEFPESVHAADGWLLTGSKHGAYEDHPFIPPLETFIRDAHAAKIPMVGICFGHQIIAQALGGRVEKFRAGWSVGRKVYTVEGLGKLALNAWHQDQVIAPPPEARVIGHSDFCANAALAVDDHIFTLQPHPEIRKGYLEGLLDVRAPGVVPQPLIDEARAAMDAPLDEARTADHIATFFKAAHTRRAEATAHG